MIKKNNVSQEAFTQNRSQEPMLSGDPDKVLMSIDKGNSYRIIWDNSYTTATQGDKLKKNLINELV